MIVSKVFCIMTQTNHKYLQNLVKINYHNHLLPYKATAQSAACLWGKLVTTVWITTKDSSKTTGSTCIKELMWSGVSLSKQWEKSNHLHGWLLLLHLRNWGRRSMCTWRAFTLICRIGPDMISDACKSSTPCYIFCPGLTRSFFCCSSSIVCSVTLVSPLFAGSFTGHF